MTRQPTPRLVRRAIDPGAVAVAPAPDPSQGAGRGADPFSELAAQLGAALDRLGHTRRVVRLPSQPMGLVRWYDNEEGGVWRLMYVDVQHTTLRTYQRDGDAETRLFAAGQMTPVPMFTPSAYLIRRVGYAEYVGNRAHHATAHRFANYATADLHRRTLPEPLEWKVVPYIADTTRRLK